ncbi:oligosaccharide flippase family protein, partial [Fusobacterium mortiferum]
MANSIIKNYIYNSGLLIFNLFFPFITMTYVNRIFSLEIIGEISLALSIISIFITLSSLGIFNCAMREVAQNRRDKDKLKKIFSKYLFLNIIGVVFFSIIYLVVIFFYLNQNRSIYIILYLNLFMSPYLLEWFFTGLEEYKYITQRSIFTKIISFIFMMLLVKNEEDINLYLIFLVLGSSLNGVFNIYKVRKYLIKIRMNFFYEILELKYFYLQNIMGIFYSGCEQIILGLNSNLDQIAYYSRSKSILSIPRMVILSLTKTLIPRINNNIQDPQKYKELITLSFDYLILLICPCIIGINFFSENILYVIGGEKFIPAKNILRVSSILLLVVSLAVFLDSNISIPNRKEKNTLYGNIGVMLVTTLCVLVLSKKYGGIGTAISVVIGESIGVIIQ